MEKIREDGEVLGENFLRVDSFLNHQIDTQLVDRIGKTIAEKFKDEKVTKVLTAEAGGNIIAYASAIHLGRLSSAEVPVIYAKKGVPRTMRNPVT